LLNELNVREFIQRGIEKPLLFPINKKLTLKFRPLGDLEVHEAYNKPLDKLNNNLDTLKAFLVSRNNGILDLDSIDIDKIDLELLMNCIDEIKAWIIYLSTRDFQDDEYVVDDVKKLNKIFELSSLILMVSGNTEYSTEIIRKFSESKEGRALRYYLESGKFKISKSLNEMTRNQMNFIQFTSKEYVKSKAIEAIENSVDGSFINFKNSEIAHKQFEMMFSCLQEEPPAPILSK